VHGRHGFGGGSVGRRDVGFAVGEDVDPRDVVLPAAPSSSSHAGGVAPPIAFHFFGFFHGWHGAGRPYARGSGFGGEAHRHGRRVVSDAAADPSRRREGGEQRRDRGLLLLRVAVVARAVVAGGGHHRSSYASLRMRQLSAHAVVCVVIVASLCRRGTAVGQAVPGAEFRGRSERCRGGDFLRCHRHSRG